MENLFAAIANFDKAQELIDANEISQAQIHAAVAKLYLSISIPPGKEKEALDSYRKRIASLGGLGKHKNTNDFREKIKEVVDKNGMIGLKSTKILEKLRKDFELAYKEICERNWLKRHGLQSEEGKEGGLPALDIEKCLSGMTKPEMPGDERLIRWIQEINREFKKATA